MARKGNQQKNGIDRNSSSLKKKVSDSGSPSLDTERQAKEGEVRVGAGEELSNGNHPRSPSAVTASKAECIRNEKKSKQKTHKFLKEENQAAMATDSPPQNMPNGSNMEDGIEKPSTREAFGSREEIGTLPSGSHGNEYAKSSYSCSQNGLHTENGMKLSSSDLLVGRNFRGFAFSTLKATGEWMDNVVSGTLRSSALSIWKASADWLERLKPLFIALAANIHKARDYARINFEQAYPIVLQWISHVGKIMLLILMVWLDCTLSGIGSFLRMGTTSFFSVIWCSILSVIAMSGIFKFLVVLAMAALIGLFVGLTLAILVIAISGTVLLWLYGSFWTTTLVIFIAGLAFLLSHERLALLVTTVYSLYCVWAYNQWTGLLLGLNLSFISSDVLVYFLKNNLNEHRRSDGPQHQAAGTRSRPGLFHNDTMHYSSSEMGSGQSEDCSPGVPSTSGADSETTSEDEVLRLLNSTDHYSALGLSRYETIDVSLLKREYKKKAMLVHPDKNMGNEKAAEAFKKLQNAYEVLLDALKRQAYDDELRREELLNYFRRFQSASQKHRNHGLFASGFARSEADGEDLLGESRRIPCKKCCTFHIWVHTKKSKSRARWCQDCQDFHQAKDGDGWVEQSSQPVFFGLFQKVDVPSAYVCAESRIYDATNWYICQGMRCPANTHKPSFHVNTSVTPKPSGRGTSSGHRGGEMPGFNMEESMTEEEIVEWLQAMQAGMFGTSSSNGTTSAKNESCSKNSGGRRSSSSSKRKKKGKKQR